MKENGLSKNIKVRKKILPALGGINHKYIRRNYCFRKTLIYLAAQLSDVVGKKNINSNENLTIQKIKEDLELLAKNSNKRIIDLYWICQKIICNY
jgi:hypothetical protein